MSMKDKPSALITGATGFVGSHLAEHLASQGWQVTLLVRPTAKEPRTALQQLPRFVFDGKTESLVEYMREQKPDVIFHLASLFRAVHVTAEVTPLVESNVLLGTQLLEAASLAGVRYFVNTGTVWQHFSGEGYDPVNLYAATKQAFESVLAYYTSATEVRAITLKLSDTYGPNDERGKLVSVLERASRTGETITMSPGEQLVDIVHIFDVVRAFRMAAERLMSDSVERQETYFVTTGHPMKLRDWVTEYARIAGLDLKIEWGVRAYRPREVMVPYSGSSLPGWKPEYDLERGVRELRQRLAAEGHGT
jgi:nucleoside-diphosphate-sugar epimerase